MQLQCCTDVVSTPMTPIPVGLRKRHRLQKNTPGAWYVAVDELPSHSRLSATDTDEYLPLKPARHTVFTGSQ